MSTLTINYDKKNDILYVSIGEPIASISEEISDGIYLRRSIETDEISGVTILDYKYKIDNKINIDLPKEIDLSLVKI